MRISIMIKNQNLTIYNMKNPVPISKQIEAFELFRTLNEQTPEHERIHIWSKFKQAFPYGLTISISCANSKKIAFELHRVYKFDQLAPSVHSYFTNITRSDYTRINGGISHGITTSSDNSYPSICIQNGYVYLDSGGVFFMKITNERIELL